MSTLKKIQRPNLHNQILRALTKGDELTTLTTLERYKTLELRKIVSDLRAEGVPIDDRWEKNQENKKRFKVYFLKNS